MELKYYLRGLGLGIVVTAIIMSVAGSSGKKTMTDAEIIARAKQLGMIEDRVLSESAKEKDDAPDKEDGADEEEDPDAEPDKPDAAGSGETGEQGQIDRTDQSIDSSQADGTDQTIAPEQDESVNEVVNLEPNDGEDDGIDGTDEERTPDERADRTGTLPSSGVPMVITIGSGDGSYAVSKKLADIGAISSPENFDTFLCQNGYDKKIRTGTYTIPADASDEQMARIITGAE